MTPDVTPDEEITKLAAYDQDATEKHLNTQIATSDKELTGQYPRQEDNPLVDLIPKVQLEAGHADVSMATMFFTGAKIPAGAVTVRQAAGLYVYENTLYVVEMTGAQLKDALEHAADFFTSWPVPSGQEMRLPGYKADSAEGVSYVIDLTQPVGQRIRELEFHGRPLDPKQKLRVAINNTRYRGGGRYDAYEGSPILCRSPQEIRELMIDYLTRTKNIPARGDGNWEIEPAEAPPAIKKAADQDTREQSR